MAMKEPKMSNAGSGKKSSGMGGKATKGSAMKPKKNCK